MAVNPNPKRNGERSRKPLTSDSTHLLLLLPGLAWQAVRGRELPSPQAPTEKTAVER